MLYLNHGPMVGQEGGVRMGTRIVSSNDRSVQKGRMKMLYKICIDEVTSFVSISVSSTGQNSLAPVSQNSRRKT